MRSICPTLPLRLEEALLPSSSSYAKMLLELIVSEAKSVAIFLDKERSGDLKTNIRSSWENKLGGGPVDVGGQTGEGPCQ